MTSAGDARSYVNEYEAAQIIYFPNLRAKIDHDFWSRLETDQHPALKKFGMVLKPGSDSFQQHRRHLLDKGMDQSLADTLCHKIHAIYDELIPLYEAVFAGYSFHRRKVSWRLNTIMAENMHIDTYKEENEEHFARMFVNLDTQPRIWHTSWRVQDMIEQASGRISPEDLEGLSRGDVWSKLNTAFFGRNSREWWDDQPRHIAFFSPGDVWVVDSRQVAHQIFYGRRALSIDFFVSKEHMNNPGVQYLNIAESFRAKQALCGRGQNT